MSWGKRPKPIISYDEGYDINPIQSEREKLGRDPDRDWTIPVDDRKPLVEPTTPLTDSEKTILIGGIEFTLIGRGHYGQNGRETVYYTSHGKMWAAYRSNSECGFWRLLIRTDLGQIQQTFFKGHYDYVQQTFIHLDLQKFINDMYYKLPPDSIPPDLPPCMSFSNERLDAELNPSIKADMYNEYKINHEMIDDPKRNIEVRPFNYLLNQPYDPERLVCGDKNDYLHFFLEVFSKLLYNSYSIRGYAKVQYHEFGLAGTMLGIGDIYCVILDKIQGGTYQDAASPSTVKLYCYACKIFKTPKSFDLYPVIDICSKDMHIMPLLCITEKVQITPAGIYSQYINCGAFICKIFEYKQQCIYNEFGQQCTKKYNYIGHRYDMLFPYKFLREAILSDCTPP